MASQESERLSDYTTVATMEWHPLLLKGTSCTYLVAFHLFFLFKLENPHGQKSLEGYSSWGHEESDTTESLTHTHTHRKGNMNSETLLSHMEYFSWLTVEIKTSGTDTNI